MDRERGKGRRGGRVHEGSRQEKEARARWGKRQILIGVEIIKLIFC